MVNINNFKNVLFMKDKNGNILKVGDIEYSRPSNGKMCDFIRWKGRVKYYVKNYFHWYGIKHLKIVILV